ncbi:MULTISPECIES: HAMP domain-containing sensor histidine kinase [unclassified Isoptericola]|uniref:sensor histidine kinase n=1 Tax=unclassified Isoptericola TaxID=2623355 RepID=UPI0027130902|nr:MULTISPECIES: HAMP domain-containing sensor histidine kinase [unclassified Isoptericola]MDO8146845.1 HAMP domain-containing sensor histidine kinase [Isoptericola sp. b515]MDO8150840.1 HAMP domain-containing sensor histidine kinase [Isoptericola sp. b408]
MSRRAGAPGSSLRLRLTLVAAGLTGAALVLGALALTTVVSQSRIAATDAVLVGTADQVAELVAEDRLPRVLAADEPGEIVQLVDASGRVVASSPNASRTLPLLAPSVLDTTSDGAQTRQDSAYGSGPVRVLVDTLPTGERVVATLPLATVEGVLGALRLSLGLVVPLLTLALGLVTWVLLGRALRPVEELRAAADRVSGVGGPGTLPVPQAQELAALARTLNAMLDRLETSAQRQIDFVADAAHELRSPIAALRTSIEVAGEHPEAYERTELMADLQHEVVRLQNLADDLLVLARVGASPLEVQDVDLREVVREAAGDVDLRGEGRAVVDPSAVVRVVRNLVDNARRFADGRVRVEVSDGVVTVDDDGPGIPAADRERVFDRFTRLGSGRGRDAGGAGLGLAIAREIAREHGGEVTLDDGALGGLRATVTLPTSADQDT